MKTVITLQDTPSQRSTARVPQLTDAHTQAILMMLREQRGRATTHQMASALRMTVHAAQPLIQQMCARGQVRRIQYCQRPLFELVLLSELTSGSIRDDVCQDVYRLLQGQRMTAESLAPHLRVSTEDVRATCIAMVWAGQLASAQEEGETRYGPALRESLPEMWTVPCEPAGSLPLLRFRPTSGVPSPKAVKITPALEAQLRAVLPSHGPWCRREVQRVAEQHGLTLSQVRRVLARRSPE